MNVASYPHAGYLVQQFPPEVGAGPARVSEMALHWRDAGARVTVITGMPNRPEGRIHPEYRRKLFVREEWRGISVLRSWLYASPKHGFARTVVNNATFMATGAIHALARGGGLDVLIASSPPFFPHLAGEAVSRMRGIPLVLEVRDLWPDYLVGMGLLGEGVASRALFAMERYLLQRAARVIVVTESFKARVVGKGVPAERVHVIPNGVDTQQYYRSSEPPPLAELGRAEGEFVVGYLGNFGAGQALSCVIKAAEHLFASNPQVRFVLAGDGPERAALERVASSARVNLSIHPTIAKEQTRAFYNACDVCLVPLAPFPILQETIPSKIFEVMACERPVIASLGGEGARIVMESGGGRITRPGESCELADAILAMMALSSDDRARMGASGREYVQRNYSRDLIAARYLELLTAVARRRNAS